MHIQKKSLSNLRQQQNSFINFITQKKGYEGILAELFLMDTKFIEEHMDKITKVKEYLQDKGISQDIINVLEEEYNQYLKGFYYGDIKDYSEDLQKKIKTNEKKLFFLKNEIVNSYKDKGFILDFLANLDTLLDQELQKAIEKAKEQVQNQTKNIHIEIQDNKKYIDENKYKMSQKKHERDLLETEIVEIEDKNILSKIFYISKQNTLKKTREIKDNEILNFKEQIDAKNNETTKLMTIQEKIENLRKGHGFLNRQDEEYFKVSFEKMVQDKDIKTTDDAVNNFHIIIAKYLESITDVIPYLQEKEIFDLLEKSKKTITYVLQNSKIERTKNIQEKINEFVNYFFIGKNRNKLWGSRIPTVYTKTRFDVDIMEIIEKLCKFDNNREYTKKNIIDAFKNGYIDKNFMDDILVHQSNFLVLDDFIRDGYIKSASLLENNADKQKVETQTSVTHCDIYFSRGFTQHAGYGYGNTEYNIKNKIFVVNTMTNFAEKGYGGPMNIDTQGGGEEMNYHDSETYGYSIISKEMKDAKPDRYRDRNIGTSIDIRDVYIFVPESKKQETEKYLEENTYTHDYDIRKEAKIIYIPEEYYKDAKRENIIPTQEKIINNFIQEQIKKDKGETKKLVPSEIYYGDELGVNSIEQGRSFIFFETINNKQEESVVSKDETGGKNNMLEYMLKDTSSTEQLLNFMKKIIPEYKLETEHANVILAKFEEIVKDKKLPMDFDKNIMKAALVVGGVSKWEHIKREYTLMKLLRDLGYTRKQTLILDLLIKQSDHFLKAPTYNDQMKLTYMKYIIQTIVGFSRRYHDMDVKDLFDLFFIYHMCIIENPVFYGHRKDDIKFLRAGKSLLESGFYNIEKIDENIIGREIATKDLQNISPVHNLKDEIQMEIKESKTDIKQPKTDIKETQAPKQKVKKIGKKKEELNANDVIKEQQETNPQINRFFQQYSPQNLIDHFKSMDPEYKKLFESSAMVNENYSIEQHTKMVLDEFDAYYNDIDLPLGIDKNLFRIFIVLHDMGKPYDRKSTTVQKTGEYSSTLKIFKKILPELSCNEKTIEIFSSLIKNNFLGKYLSFKEKEYKNFKIVGDMISKEAQRLDISVKDFYDILEIYYKCDAGSYPFIKRLLFTGKDFNQNTKNDIYQLKAYIHYDIAA